MPFQAEMNFLSFAGLSSRPEIWPRKKQPPGAYQRNGIVMRLLKIAPRPRTMAVDPARFQI
jgi:hypothetical protein